MDQERELCQKLEAMAKDPTNRRYMMTSEKQTLPCGVDVFLKSKNPETMESAVNVVYLLSLYPPNRVKMIANPELLQIIKKLMVGGPNAQIKRRAIAAYTSLRKATETSSQENTSSRVPSVVIKDNTAGALKSSKAASSKWSVGFGNTNSVVAASKATSITLYMNELTNDERKDEFERKMINFRGVVSFWVDLRQQKAVIRTTLTSESLQKGISSTLGWTSSIDRAALAGGGSRGQSGYADAEIGAGAVVAHGRKSAKQKSGGSWWSYVWS